MVDVSRGRFVRIAMAIPIYDPPPHDRNRGPDTGDILRGQRSFPMERYGNIKPIFRSQYAPARSIRELIFRRFGKSERINSNVSIARDDFVEKGSRPTNIFDRDRAQMAIATRRWNRVSRLPFGHKLGRENRRFTGEPRPLRICSSFLRSSQWLWFGAEWSWVSCWRRAHPTRQLSSECR